MPTGGALQRVIDYFARRTGDGDFPCQAAQERLALFGIFNIEDARDEPRHGLTLAARRRRSWHRRERAGTADARRRCLRRRRRGRRQRERLGHGHRRPPRPSGGTPRRPPPLAGSAVETDFENVLGLGRLFEGHAGGARVDATHGANGCAFLGVHARIELIAQQPNFTRGGVVGRSAVRRRRCRRRVRCPA